MIHGEFSTYITVVLHDYRAISGLVADAFVNEHVGPQVAGLHTHDLARAAQTSHHNISIVVRLLHAYSLHALSYLGLPGAHGVCIDEDDHAAKDDDCEEHPVVFVFNEEFHVLIVLRRAALLVNAACHGESYQKRHGDEGKENLQVPVTVTRQPAGNTFTERRVDKSEGKDDT